jgi:hypothetical protein
MRSDWDFPEEDAADGFYGGCNGAQVKNNSLQGLKFSPDLPISARTKSGHKIILK